MRGTLQNSVSEFGYRAMFYHAVDDVGYIAESCPVSRVLSAYASIQPHAYAYGGAAQLM